MYLSINYFSLGSLVSKLISIEQLNLQFGSIPCFACSILNRNPPPKKAKFLNEIKIRMVVVLITDVRPCFRFREKLIILAANQPDDFFFADSHHLGASSKPVSLLDRLQKANLQNLYRTLIFLADNLEKDFNFCGASSDSQASIYLHYIF